MKVRIVIAFILAGVSSSVAASPIYVKSCDVLLKEIPHTFPQVLQSVDSCIEINQPGKHNIIAIVSFTDVVRDSVEATLQNTWGHNICQTMTGSVNQSTKKVAYSCNHDSSADTSGISFSNLEGIYPCPMSETNDELSYGYSTDPAGGVSSLECIASKPEIIDGVQHLKARAWLMFNLPIVKEAHIFGAIKTSTKRSLKGIRINLQNLTTRKDSVVRTNKVGEFRFDLMEGDQYVATPKGRNSHEAFSPSRIRGTISGDIDRVFKLRQK